MEKETEYYIHYVAHTQVINVHSGVVLSVVTNVKLSSH